MLTDTLSETALLFTKSFLISSSIYLLLTIIDTHKFTLSTSEAGNSSYIPQTPLIQSGVNSVFQYR